MMRSTYSLFVTVALFLSRANLSFGAFATPKAMVPPPAKVGTAAGQENNKLFKSSSTAIRSLRGGAVAAEALKTTPAWVALCGKLAPTASVGLAAASLPTILHVQKDKTVGDLPLLPYSSLIANGFVWFLYGVLKKEAKVWSCNAAAVMLGVYYMWGFTKYSPKKSPTLPGSVSQHVLGTLSTIAATILIAVLLPTERAAAILGGMGVAFCIGLFASPLSALKTVFQTKSAKSIPLPFTIATIVSCFLWSVTGLLDMNDFNIYIPNLIGLTFGIVQILLKFIYGNGRDTAKATV